MAFCWENGFHGVLSDDGEFLMFNPPKYFSAHEIKLSFQHDLNTTEFKIEKMAKDLDLNPSRFCLVGALLGNESLFRNKRFARNEMFQRNASKFAIFHA